MKIKNSALFLLVCCLAVASISGCATTSTPQGLRPVPPEATTDNERIGDMFLQSNKLDEALIQYDMAMEAGANRASVAFRKGFVYLAKSMWQESLDWFTVAIGNDPTMTLAYEGAGKATLEMGHLRNAAAFFEGATQHSPDYWVPHVYLSAIYDVVEREQESMRHAEIARTLVEEGDSSIYMTLAVAQKRAENALEMNPEEALEWAHSLEGTQTTASERPQTMEPQTMEPQEGETELAMAENEESSMDEADLADSGSDDMAMDEASEEPDDAALAESDMGEEAGDTTMAPMPPEDEDMAAEESAEPGDDQSVLDQAVESARQEAGHGDTQDAGQDVTSPENEGQVAIAGGQASEQEQETAQEPAEEPAAETAQEAVEEPATASEEPAQAAQAEPEQERAPTMADETAAEAAMPPAQGQEVAALDPSGYSYSILESSWRTEEEARVRTSDLMDMGITANIVPVNLPEKGLWYRVMIGEYANLDVAERMKGKLVEDFHLSHLNILRDGRFFQTVE